MSAIIHRVNLGIFVGTRPDIIKMASIIRIASRLKRFRVLLVHTGQHYDIEMSERFFDELRIPRPHIYLGVGSGSHGVQTARILVMSERVLRSAHLDFVLLCGDTNSSLAVALAASKLKIPVAHVEAGCRSFDKEMAEEINRIVIADLACLNFAPTRTARRNLIAEGVSPKSIFLTGHPLVDVLRYIKPRLRNSGTLKRYGIAPRRFYLFTCHRQETVDDRTTLQWILLAMARLAKYGKVIFPIHPHTQKRIAQFGMRRLLSGMIVTVPLGYLEVLWLIKHARLVITDSGGIQQEAALLRTPCVTVRSTTEWVETVAGQVNFIAGRSFRGIIRTVAHVERDYLTIVRNFRNRKFFGRPGASKRILEIIATHARK